MLLNYTIGYMCSQFTYRYCTPHVVGQSVRQSWKKFFHSVPRSSPATPDVEVAFALGRRCHKLAADLLSLV